MERTQPDLFKSTPRTYRACRPSITIASVILSRGFCTAESLVLAPFAGGFLSFNSTYRFHPIAAASRGDPTSLCCVTSHRLATFVSKIEVRQLLKAWGAGDNRALEQL